jgi:hypothetical protein
MTASAATAKAMSVAVGMAHPFRVGAAGDHQIQQRRSDHPAERRRHWNHRSARVPQITGHELALQLNPRYEEEDRQQPVTGPLRHREVQMQCGRADLGAGQLKVAVRNRSIGPQQGHDGRKQQ